MAIFGIGAFYDNQRDVTSEFLNQEAACVGWPEREAPALHVLLRHIRTGDIIYIKAHPPGRDLTVKAVGIVTEAAIDDYPELGRGIRVRWVWTGNEILHEAANERYNVRNNTLYEEFSPTIQTRILGFLLSRLASS